MGISRTWPRASDSALPRCLRNQSSLWRLHGSYRTWWTPLQVACTGVLEMTVRTDFSPDFYDGVRLMVICQLRKNSGTLRHFAFYSWDKTATMEATLAELNQHVQFLIELDKRPAYETKT